MYKILTIGNKDYKIEYSIEASLYKDCTEKLIGFLGNVSAGIIDEKAFEKKSEADKLKYIKMKISETLSGLSDLPATAFTVFYAGLIKHHGNRGDKTILSEDNAIDLVEILFEEQAGKEDAIDNFYSLLSVCINQMGEDGFFKLTGLETMLNSIPKDTKNRATRRATKKTEKAIKSKS